MNDLMNSDSDLRALAAIDPAGPRNPSAHRSASATAMLEATLASTTGSEATTGTDRATVVPLAPRRTIKRRWTLLAAAAAVAGLAFAAVNILPSGNAYADWTDVPAAPSADDVAQVQQGCIDMWSRALGPDAPDQPTQAQVAAADVVVAEQRGSYTYVVMTIDNWAFDCLMTGGLFGPDGGGSGSLQNLDNYPIPGPDELTTASVGAMTHNDDPAVVTMYARVGANVDKAVIHVPGVGDVEATVSNGYLAAWAPNIDMSQWETIGVSVTLYLTDHTQVEIPADHLGWAAGN